MFNYIKKLYWSVKNKISNKLFYFVTIKSKGTTKGYVLLSYITSPFIDFPWEFKTDPHSNYWECAEIARLFSDKGYTVHCINANQHKFVPKIKYDVCIDIQLDIDRLAKFLNKDCIKVLHIDNPYYPEYNKREVRQVEDLYKRRGTKLSLRRQINNINCISVVDYLEGFGNDSVHETFRKFNKTIFKIPVSVTKIFEFPYNKNFNSVRNNFLYFGGGGAILKGLDLTIEAFSKLPDYNLTIVGPMSAEKDFLNEFKDELSKPNIKYLGRPKIDKNGKITVGSLDIKDIFDSCLALVYPSSADGTSTAVAQSIQAGLIPIVSIETGLYEDLNAIIIPDKKTESIMDAVTKLSKKDSAELKELAFNYWKYANDHYTKNEFSKAYSNFINTVLKI